MRQSDSEGEKALMMSASSWKRRKSESTAWAGLKPANAMRPTVSWSASTSSVYQPRLASCAWSNVATVFAFNASSFKRCFSIAHCGVSVSKSKPASFTIPKGFAASSAVVFQPTAGLLPLPKQGLFHCAMVKSLGPRSHEINSADSKRVCFPLGTAAKGSRTQWEVTLPCTVAPNRHNTLKTWTLRSEDNTCQPFIIEHRSRHHRARDVVGLSHCLVSSRRF